MRSFVFNNCNKARGGSSAASAGGRGVLSLICIVGTDWDVDGEGGGVGDRSRSFLAKTEKERETTPGRST